MTEPVPRPLSALKPGESGTIVRMASTAVERVVKLSGMGVMPGARVTVVQHRPALVLTVAQTTIALDREIADEIVVTPDRAR